MKTLNKVETKFAAIEDNGGGLHLAVFEGTECVAFFSGFELNLYSLVESINYLDDGFSDWEGNAEDPQADYDSLTSHQYGWDLIADNGGIYADKMGVAAQREFDTNELEEKQLEAIQEEIKIFKKENNIIEPEFKIGDAVWFTDPDNNEDSGWYKITGIVDDGSIAIFYIENEYNSDIEAYSHELSDQAPDPISLTLDFANAAYENGEVLLNKQLPMGDRGDGLADFIVNELNDVLKGETDPQVIQEIIRNALGLSVRQLKGVINDICDSPALEEALNNKPIHSEELDIFQLVLDIANQAYEKGELCLNEPLENRDLGDGLADFIVNELKEVSLISLFWLMDVTEPEVIQEAVRNALESAVQQIENVIEGTSDNPDFEQLLIDRQNNPYRPGVEALNDSIKASEPGM